jgi:hypothetical protein
MKVSRRTLDNAVINAEKQQARGATDPPRSGPQHQLEKYANVPQAYVPHTKFGDQTANGLTACVTTWFLLNGNKAWRQSSEGRL